MNRGKACKETLHVWLHSDNNCLLSKLTKVYKAWVICEAIFTQVGSIFETRSQRFDLSARSIGHLLVWLASRETVAGGRSGQPKPSQWPRLLVGKSKRDRVSKIDPKWVTFASLSIWLLDPITLSQIWLICEATCFVYAWLPHTLITLHHVLQASWLFSSVASSCLTTLTWTCRPSPRSPCSRRSGQSHSSQVGHRLLIVLGKVFSCWCFVYVCFPSKVCVMHDINRYLSGDCWQ